LFAAYHQAKGGKMLSPNQNARVSSISKNDYVGVG
jgi:hypothetical protein